MTNVNERGFKDATCRQFDFLATCGCDIYMKPNDIDRTHEIHTINLVVLTRTAHSPLKQPRYEDYDINKRIKKVFVYWKIFLYKLFVY